MLKALGFLIKLAVFSLVVLILGNQIHWGSKTVSDQVKSRLSHAERSPTAQKLRGWASQLSEDAAAGIRNHVPESFGSGKMEIEAIPASEKQKLKALIQGPNLKHAKN